MNDSMDKNLQMIRDLYEAETDLRDLRLLDSQEPGLGDEYSSMREMKALLGARPRQKPSVHAVQAVLKAAAEKSAGIGPRRDRAPLARRSAVYLRVGALSAVVIVLLTVVTVLQIDLPDGTVTVEEPLVKNETEDASELASPPSNLFGEEADAGVAQPENPVLHAQNSGRETGRRERTDRAVEPEQRSLIARLDGQRRRPTLESLFEAQPAAFQSAFAGMPAFDMEGEDVLSWDQSGDVIQVYQHIEMIGGGVDRGWEPPSVPLEMLPQNRRTQPAIQPAGQRELH